MQGIYDSGSNVSLINSRFLKIKNKNFGNSKIRTINGVKRTSGLTNLSIKIFNIEENTDVVKKILVMIF